MIKIKIDESIKNIKNTDIDIKEVRGQENALWKELKTFDIIVNLKSFYRGFKPEAERFDMYIKYPGTLEGRKLFPITKENKENEVRYEVPYGVRVYVYFERNSSIDSSDAFNMLIYKNEKLAGREFIIMKGAGKAISKEYLVTGGKYTPKPIIIELMAE